MNADTISIIVSVITVGAAGGALTMAGFKQLRQDMDRRFTEFREEMDRRFTESREDIREVRRDVNMLREAVGALRERTGGTATT